MCSEQGKVCRYKTHGYVSLPAVYVSPEMMLMKFRQDAYCVSQQEIDAAPAHDRYVENIIVADALSPADGF